MKRAVIVHCWGGEPNYAWYPWVKTELEKKGYLVQVPAMPETETPKLALWLPKLKETIGMPDNELVLVGHSLGSVTILRYLETLESSQAINKAILVAGFSDNLGFEELVNFFEEPFNTTKIKNAVQNGIVAIQSDNDPFIPFEKFKEILETDFNAKIIVKHGAKHMSGPLDNEESCLRLPEVMKGLENE